MRSEQTGRHDMILGLGVDIVEVGRIRSALKNANRMVNRVFTAGEIRYCLGRKNRFQHFAGRFAAKEAALKALGTGWQRGIAWKDVEVSSNELGKPQLTFHGKAKRIFQESGSRRAQLSITHAQEYAVAVVILEN